MIPLQYIYQAMMRRRYSIDIFFIISIRTLRKGLQLVWCPTSFREKKVKVHICKTLTQHYRSVFLEGVGPTKKENRDGLVGSRVPL